MANRRPPNAGKGRKAGVPNKATTGIKALAAPYSEEAVLFLVGVMRDKQAAIQARVAAAKELLDRGHGKAPQAVAVSGDPDGVPIRQIINQYVSADSSQP